jgi:cytochrome c
MKIIQSIFVLSLSSITVSTAALADEGADLYMSKTCNVCHGTDAKTPIMPNYPKIAGQSKEYITQQMTDIKSGARSNGQSAAMKTIMANVSEEEIDKIADYVSALK